MKKILNKTRAILLLLFTTLYLTGYSQVQESWVYRIESYESLKAFFILDNNENIILGDHTYSFDDENQVHKTIKLLKLKPDGSKIFEIAEKDEVEYERSLIGIVTDGAGNIYCGVSLIRHVTPSTPKVLGLFAVYKYNSNGTAVWKRNYGDGELNIPNSIAVDETGNVYLTGQCREDGTTGSEDLPDYLTVKWSSDGSLQWANRYDGASPGEGYNVASDVAVDGSGNVYVTGASQRDGKIGFATLKYNSAGTLQWDQRYTSMLNYDSRAKAINLDNSGFVYVTGESDGGIATIKYDNDGNQVWIQKDGGGGGEGREIKIDESGNVYVVGNASQVSLAVIKYNSEGIKQWSSGAGSAGYAMDIDAHGNVYVGGTRSNNAVTIKYNSNGNQQWVMSNESPLRPGINNPIAVTENGNVYVISYVSYDRNGNSFPRYHANLHKYTQCDLICPSNVIVNTAPGACSALVNFSVNQTGDCGNEITYSHAPGTVFPQGTTTVTVSSTATGETCSFTVTVNDNENPVARSKNVILQLNESGTAILTAADVDNGSSDNCGIQSFSLSKSSFSCSDIGNNIVTLTVFDVNGNSATCTANVTVQDVTPPVVRTKNISAYLNETGTVSITAADVDDGSSDECGSVLLGINKTVFSCDDKGPNLVILTVTDANGNAVSGSAIVNVIDNTPPTINAVSASPTSLWPSDRKMKPVTISASVSDNCPATTWQVSAVTIKAGEFENDNVNPDFEITGQNTVNLRAEIPKRGTRRAYTVTITATDAAGNISTSSVDVDVSLNITTPASGAPFKAGSTIDLSGEFWDLPGRTHTAQWLIDNSTTVKASVTQATGNNNGEVKSSYKFNNPGVYKLQMKISDQYGQTRYANTNENLDAIVVIYDPKGGYTYGGGKFTSQAGALVSNPAATGEVSFGFTVNYQKGKPPKGETQFDFKLGDFEFNALNFEYLAISDVKAQFRGTGRIIGFQSGIAFIMTVIDGELDGSGIDKVRMKIWNKNTGQIYYDNQPGSSDADDPTTPIGENSTIVIAGTNAPVTNISHDIIKEVIPDAEKLLVMAFPNPYQRQFSLAISSPASGRATIEFFTLTGAKVYQEEKLVTVGTRNYFSYPGLDRYGTLMYRITIGSKQVSGLVIKQ